VSPEAMFWTAEHDPTARMFDGRLREVKIGDQVWIATRALLLPGAEVGDGVVVAAGAVVRGVIPPWTIVAGNPAREVGDRPEGAQSRSMYTRRWFR
jgi:acetyltransferase-like isoleucine patch superfamily enzyme